MASTDIEKITTHSILQKRLYQLAKSKALTPELLQKVIKHPSAKNIQTNYYAKTIQYMAEYNQKAQLIFLFCYGQITKMTDKQWKDALEATNDIEIRKLIMTQSKFLIALTIEDIAPLIFLFENTLFIENKLPFEVKNKQFDQFNLQYARFRHAHIGRQAKVISILENVEMPNEIATLIIEFEDMTTVEKDFKTQFEQHMLTLSPHMKQTQENTWYFKPVKSSVKSNECNVCKQVLLHITDVKPLSREAYQTLLKDNQISDNAGDKTKNLLKNFEDLYFAPAEEKAPQRLSLTRK